MSLKKTALFLLALISLSPATALLAQVPHFILSSTSYQLRQHGQTELLGDVTLTCDVPGAFPNPSAVTIVFGPVYSLVNSTGGYFVSASAQPFNARTAYAESEPATTAIVVSPAQYNAAVRNSISIPISGTAALHDIIRISGIRANIAEAGLPSNQFIYATVTASPPNALQIDNETTVSVAYVLDEITASVTPTDPMIICQPTNCRTASITVNEKFPSALTSLAEENSLQRTPLNGKPVANGTQILINLMSIMPGVTVTWPQTVTEGTLTVAVPGGTTPIFFNASATNVTATTIVYDVSSDNQTASESITIPITFCPTTIPIPAVYGTITTQILLGPITGTGLVSNVPSSELLSFVRNPINDPPSGLVSLTGVACAANLAIQNLALSPATIPTGSNSTVNFDIRNLGAGTASPSTTSIHFNTSPTGVSSGDLLIASLSTPTIPSNGMVSVSQSLPIPCNLRLGTYYVWVNLDVNRTAHQDRFDDDQGVAPLTLTSSTCASPPSQTSQSYSANGGVGNISITAPLGCSWSARSNVPWLLVITPPIVVGTGTATYTVTMNPNSNSRTGTITIAGTTYVVVQAGAGSGGFTTTLTPGSGISKVSLNQGGLSVLYGQITATSPPAAMTNFGLTQNGNLVTEVGVPAASLVTYTRLFVDLTSGFNSGIALVNPNDTPILITLEAQDSNGQRAKRSNPGLVPQGTLTVPPHGHVARFVSEMGLNLPANFMGTLTLSSCSPFAAINLRSATNGHGEAIFTALPLADLSNPPGGNSLMFPQIVDGGGLPTQILLMNPSADVTSTGTISLFGDDGSALSLDFGSGPQSSLSYSLAPNGMAKFTTTGNGPVRVGYALVMPASGPLPLGSGIFTSRSGYGIASQAGVPNAPATTAAQMFVDVATSPVSRNTGVALVNLNAATATVNLTLVGFDGRSISGSFTIPPNGHVAKFINELLPAVPASYQGVLTLTSNVPVSALTLRLTKNQRGEDIYSTLPVADLNNPPAGALFLPQLVDGGGFQTQLILLNPSSNANPVLIDFFNDSGVSIPLTLQ